MTMNGDELLIRVAKGNAEALQFLKSITFIAHIWDDLIDRDVLVSDEQINHAFQAALIDLPYNNFYLDHLQQIRPLMVIAVQNWMAATRMERGGHPGDLNIAFVLRSSYVDLITMVAWIVGGDEWAQKMTLEIRRATHKEGYRNYLNNLAVEREARKEN